MVASLVCAGVCAGLLGARVDGAPGARGQPASEAALEAYTERVEGTSVTFRMVPIPAGDGHEAVWMSETEVTWDLYDIFVYGLDEDAEDAEDDAADAVTRPSKPYVPPDRGFGHAGYPAMGMTLEAADRFCEWLRLKTGRKYRLPTASEWERACLAGSEGAYWFGDDAAALGEHAWFAGNAEHTTHPVGEKPANAWGLHDMHGNVAEWVLGAEAGERVAAGGSYRDDAADCTAASRQRQTPAWNASDPQFPKSQWWLADCGFVGMRLVCEPGEGR